MARFGQRSAQRQATQTGAAFPLVVSPNRRYLVDQNGRPFQIRGCSGWCAAVQLTRPQVDAYLDDRKARGFNSILIEVIESGTFGGPSNAYSASPFVGSDFTVRNEAYWQHIDYIVTAARQRGMVVQMSALYLGASGGSEGWYSEAVSQGTSAVQNYGAFLGARYKNARNIIWVNGGDYRPPTLAIPNALVTGVQSAGDTHLWTTHWARNSTGTDGSPIWLTLNCSYTSDDNVASRVLSDYQTDTTLPTLLFEAHYEGSFDTSPTLTAKQCRIQSWHADLSGACGSNYGHHTVWQFISGWESALNSAGAQSMAHKHAFFERIRWWSLVPDASSAMVTAGRGTLTSASYVAAARSADGQLGVAYIPNGGSIDIDLSTFSGPVKATWMDAATGVYTPAGSFANSGTQSFDPTGTADAALLLEV